MFCLLTNFGGTVKATAKFALYQASYDLLIAQFDLIFPVRDHQKMMKGLVY
jgi:hypothetical protein